MIDTKIIQVLKGFGKEEMKQFGYFVESPYFNRVKSVTKLFEAIKPYYPEFTSRSMNRESVYRKITGGAPYNDAVMRNLISDLYQLVGEFAAINLFRKRENHKGLMSLAELKRFAGDKNIIAELERLGEKLEQKTNRDEEYYFDLFTYWNTRNNSFEAKTVEMFHKYIEKEIENLSQYYILHLFDRFFQANRLRTSYKTHAKHSFLEEASEVLKKYGYMESPAARTYYRVYMLTMTMDEKHYFALKELLNENMDLLSKYTRYIIFQSLSVFFMNMQRQGKKEFNRDRFELFRDYAASGEIIYNNSLSDALYTSAVVAALNVGEFDWAEKFNEEYRASLESSIRQDAYYYNIARILHAKGKNEEALKYLARVISTHHPIKAVVKVIELQILYELNEIDTTELKLDSLRHFFTRSEEMNNSMRESLKNFHRTYGMLLKAKTGEGKHKAGEIRKFLSGKRQSFSMEWLKEKIEELEGRKFIK